ncbi:hypothetical protein BDA96_01G077500 [Sorghum bicolor]|jgi:hypothetical protein|uniref:Transmembrane protein n=1 Tax=Sorghum bicolor TaxID=4558 RepID=A0A921UWV5_SORBI|nr:hypothetical protein BDA96_01G077500 [Sorghum bicolor]
MLRQSSSRSHRSKKLRASHSFQAFLLVAVAIWIVYQLTHSYGEQRPAVSVETGGSNDAEPARRRLGRKGFVHFPGHASVDDIAGAGESSVDPLSKAGDGEGEGDEEDREADEDDGAADADVDDGLAAAADEEDDGIDFQSQDGSREDGAKAVHGGTQNGLNISVAPPVNGTGTVQDGAAVLLLRNATGGAADGNGTVPTLSGSASALNNISSVDVASSRDRGTAGDAANSFVVGAPGAEEKPTSTGNSGHGIST